MNLPNARKTHWYEGIIAEDMDKITWLKPKVVAEIAFTEWTAEGLLRHARYVARGEPSQVVRNTSNPDAPSSSWRRPTSSWATVFRNDVLAAVRVFDARSIRR